MFPLYIYTNQVFSRLVATRTWLPSISTPHRKSYFVITEMGKQTLIAAQEARQLLWQQIPKHVVDPGKA